MVSLKHFMALIIAIAVILPAASAMVGGDKAWFLVHSNVDDANVYFGGEYKGQTTNGELYIEYYTTGTPVTNFMVQKDGYTTYSGAITQFPAKGEVVDLYATLQQAQPTPMPAPIGGSIGYYTVYANVNGASVYFDSDFKGTIANGELTVQVYTTGTPY
ncbi:MAG: PEGA domain-containing protein, partial [Methanocalculus sp.]|uniref:PEGA domain-containing protein n=1 Tax=Methanocalculus sp. TaxID=2004547 RepID=UPI0027167E85